MVEECVAIKVGERETCPFYINVSLKASSGQASSAQGGVGGLLKSPVAPGPSNDRTW